MTTAGVCMIYTGMNHITLAVTKIERSFIFHRDIYL